MIFPPMTMYLNDIYARSSTFAAHAHSVETSVLGSDCGSDIGIGTHASHLSTYMCGFVGDYVSETAATVFDPDDRGAP